jgi:hypothetical protein
MKDADDVYAFVFKAQLAQEAVDSALSRTASPVDQAERIASRMPLELFHKDLVSSASKMAFVYTAIAAFENSARKFINDRMLENVGPNWWSQVSAAIRKGAEDRKRDEDQIRWHGSRGTSMIYYTQLGDLVAIMQQNLALFESHIESIDWARQLFKSLERSRNVIMHSGELSMADIERVAMNIRDWLRQVGG